MGRDEYFIAASLRSLEDSLHILDCAVLGNARADRSPICPPSRSAHRFAGQ
jgi:hypothetical protein